MIHPFSRLENGSLTFFPSFLPSGTRQRQSARSINGWRIHSVEVGKSLLGTEINRIVDSILFGWYESIFQS